MDSRSFAITPMLAAAMLAGVLVVQALPVLPGTGWIACIAVLGVALAHRRWFAVAVLAFGFAWAALHATWAMDARLPVDLERRDIVVSGRIDDLPLQRADASRFVLQLESASVDGAPLPLHGKLRLAWYAADVPVIAPCSRWQLRLRLKRPRGLVNPVGFDFERHALERGIVAVGYVIDPASAKPLGPAAFCIDRWRDRIARGIGAAVADQHDAAILQALAVGDTRGLQPADWEVARANGVTHLLSISGFHVGVAALFGAWLARACCWLWPVIGLRWPRPLLESVAALSAAIAYGALAGNSLPTLRTVLMIAVFVLTRISRRHGSGPQALALAALALLVVDPLAVLGAGFWLSFVGVAFLMLGLQPPRNLLGHARALGSAQWVMTLALLPLSFWFFGQASLLGVLANLLAIPLVSLAIVPLALLSALLLLIAAPLATLPLAIAAWLVHLQWSLWAAMAQWPGAQWNLPEVTIASLLLAVTGALWTFLPRGLPLRWLGLLLFLPLLWPRLQSIANGEFDVLFIDVGQGLSVLVRTREHALLYDAGARFPSGFDLGTAAVLPSLHGIGVDRIDVAIVSHADNDHAGGMPVVLKVWPQATVIGGEPARGDVAASLCKADQQWQWDGVTIRVLRPAAQDSVASDSNDRSCVVLVEGQGGRLLLTGDISSRIEAMLVDDRAPGDARPLLLSVAHHGSRRSSSAAFLKAWHPTMAVVSAAWLSRFGHPHPLVVERLADAGIALINTADSGAVEVRVGVDGSMQVVRHRERRRAYWRE